MKKFGLNTNQIKLIAAVSMLIDHVGYFLFPSVAVFRIIGRLAFPIFAFCLAEGCRYTRNRLRYFLQMAGCAVVFQFVAVLTEGANVPVNIFGTLSISILLCFVFDKLKSKKIGGFLLFLLFVFAVYVLTSLVEFDYGFLGTLVPLSVFVFEVNPTEPTPNVEPTLSLDPPTPPSTVGKWSRFLAFTLTLAALAAVSGWNIQYYSLLAVPILSFYNGQYGSKKYKYWFYAFYPAHLILIYFIGLILK